MKKPSIVAQELSSEIVKTVKDAHHNIPEHMIEDARLRGNPSGIFGRYERKKFLLWSTGFVVWALYLFNTFPLEWMKSTDPESKAHAFWVLFGPLFTFLYLWLKDNSSKLAHK